MRLDKYIADTGIASRREAAKAARSGLVSVNGETVRDVSVHIDEKTASVIYCGAPLKREQYTYVMLNKPAGYISSTEPGAKTVMTLLPDEFTKMKMFPCGRLDIDTVGLLLICNDGPLAHELLSPRRHAEKTYGFRCAPPIDSDAARKLEAGVDIGGYVTKPCRVQLSDTGDSGEITLTEGKFHQIKRMFSSQGSEIVYLRRLSFGGIKLDESLKEGEWRRLTDGEIETLRCACAASGKTDN